MLLFTNINKGIEEYRTTPDALLIDVREADEFNNGHIPGAVNEPLSGMENPLLPKERMLFLYCLRGTRSKRAAAILKKKGDSVKSIGGIKKYTGKIERQEPSFYFQFVSKRYQPVRLRRRTNRPSGKRAGRLRERRFSCR